jgi:hypothetical protein
MASIDNHIQTKKNCERGTQLKYSGFALGDCLNNGSSRFKRQNNTTKLKVSRSSAVGW